MEQATPWIVIPAYNAAATVAEVARAAAARTGLPVLVVDDGSQDGTADAARAAGVKLLCHPENRGKGAALRSGFAEALRHGAPAVITMDADGQHDPAELPGLLAAHRAAPEALVIGVRSFDPALMPRRSRVGNHISTFFISVFAGRRYRDTQSGYRIYPAALLRRAPYRGQRFEIETELLLWSSKLDILTREVPIATLYGGAAGAPRTHFRNVHDTLRILRLVVGSPLWRAKAAVPVNDAPTPLSQPDLEMEAT